MVKREQETSELIAVNVYWKSFRVTPSGSDVSLSLTHSFF